MSPAARARLSRIPDLRDLYLAASEVEFVRRGRVNGPVRGVVVEYHSPAECLPAPCSLHRHPALHQEPSVVVAVPYWGRVAGVLRRHIRRVIPPGRW